MKSVGVHTMGSILRLLVFAAAIEFSHSAIAEDSSNPIAPSPVKTVDEVKTVIDKETVWLDDRLLFNAKTEGGWLWDTATVTGSTKSHEHSLTKGLNRHNFTADPVLLPVDGMVTQQVWLDPKNPPKGIMLEFKRVTGETVAVYWEGEEEVFNLEDKRNILYAGVLPEVGKWTKLEIPTENLGMDEDTKVIGLSFATFDGRALWGKTTITESVPLEGSRALPQNPKHPKVPHGKHGDKSQ